MCMSVVAVASNELMELQRDEGRLLGSYFFNSFEMDCSCSGKKRKISRTDSPNSSTFDLGELLDAIHREVEGEDVLPTKEYLTVGPSRIALYDDFDFIDISETPSSEYLAPPSLSIPPLTDLQVVQPNESPKQCALVKQSPLGKRSRGLGRSQTITTGLCQLGEA
jgi:hypothetical protein